MRDAARWREAVVPAVYLAAVVLTFRQYGITWDESIQSRYGELALAYFTSGLRDRSVDHLINLRFYGPLFEMIAAAFSRIAPAFNYEIRHLLIALTGVGAVIGAGRFCRKIDVNPVAGQLLLAANPQFYGSAFNNSKDIPLACAAVWTMVGFANLAERCRSRWRTGTVVLAGIALGAALAIRAGALLFALIAAVALVISALIDRDLPWKRIAAAFAAAVAIAWIVMVLFWPWAQRNPIVNPLEALHFEASFPSIYPVLFEGRIVRSVDLPRRYLVEMLAITMPLATLALMIAGCVVLARRRTPAAVLALAWLVIPIALFTILRPNVYDGIRHFFFLIPAIAVIAAAGFELIPRFRPAVLAIAVAIPVVAMIRLHPYESTYYNAAVGGTAGASGRFETDYWASSYRDAAIWLNAHACPGRPTRVLVAATVFSKECLTHYLAPRTFMVVRTIDSGTRGPLPPVFDYYVAVARFGYDRNFDATPVAHTIGREGAAFTIIRGTCRR